MPQIFYYSCILYCWFFLHTSNICASSTMSPVGMLGHLCILQHLPVQQSHFSFAFEHTSSVYVVHVQFTYQCQSNIDTVMTSLNSALSSHVSCESCQSSKAAVSSSLDRIYVWEKKGQSNKQVYLNTVATILVSAVRGHLFLVFF